MAKVLGDGSGGRDAVVAGLRWAASYERGRVDVICLALGEDFPSVLGTRVERSTSGPDARRVAIAHGLREYLQYLRIYERLSVIATAIGKGAVIVTPAGNDSTEHLRAPVSSPLSVAQGVVSVGAVEQSREGYKVPYFSNSFPTFCAPGGNIRSAVSGSRLEERTGTSMACAHAAAVAAHWWEHLRSRSNAEVTSRMVVAEMIKAARPDGFAKEVQPIERGAGLVQVPPP